MLIYADKVFENPIEVIEAFCPNQVKPALDKVEFLKNKGLYLVGYMRYDLKKIADNLPLVYFEAFDSYKPFEHKVPDCKISGRPTIEAHKTLPALQKFRPCKSSTKPS